MINSCKYMFKQKTYFKIFVFNCFHAVCSYIFVIFLLKDYRQKHPEVTILDPPDAIKHLHNRQSMLQDVADLNLSDCNGSLHFLLYCSNHFCDLFDIFLETVGYLDKIIH